MNSAARQDQPGLGVDQCCPQPLAAASASANTQLLQRSRFHQARLVSNVVPSSLVWQSGLPGLTHYFTAHGASPGSAQSRAIAHISQMIDGQATLMAYIDVFYTWAIFAALLVPVVLLL